MLWLLIIPILLGIYQYLNKHFYSQWTNLGIKSLPAYYPFGNIKKLMFGQVGLCDIIKEWHDTCNGKFMGIYIVTSPVLLVKDPDLIKQILVKDFNNFMDRGIYTDEKKEPTSTHLFRMSGAKWRDMRTKLTPAFTSGKLKNMFKTLTDVAKKMNSYLFKIVENSGSDLDIEDLTTRYNADIIASSIFGLDINSFQHRDNEFIQMAKDLFISNSLYRIVKGTFQMFFPTIFKYFHASSVKQAQNEFVFKMVNDVVEYRETNKIVRMDLMQMLIQLKNKGRVYDDNDQKNLSALENDNLAGGLSINEVAAQAYTFFFAGFETASTTMNFLLYECAINHELQDRIRQEIDDVLAKFDGNITYESVTEMVYLDRCISETLRKYPVLPYLNRIVTEEYTIPHTDIKLKKGTKILISVSGLHYDEKNFQQPHKFDPDRFDGENVKKHHKFTYLPFGEGPRNCIGKRMGKMMVAVGIATILNNYYVEGCDKTDIPMKFNKLSFFIKPLNTVQLRIVKK